MREDIPLIISDISYCIYNTDDILLMYAADALLMSDILLYCLFIYYG